MSGLFVAVGDSFTEGVGDPHVHYPNQVRGWADRLARQLGRADPAWRYANLAIRSKFLDQVVADQLDLAIAMRPTHVSFAAGGNDLLSLRADVDGIAARYEAALRRLVDTGAQVIVFTTFVPQASGLLKPLTRRVEGLNTAIRDGFDLGWKLAWVLRGWSDESLLDTYERERRPVAEFNTGRSARADGSLLANVIGLNADIGGRIPHVWVSREDRLVSSVPASRSIT